MFLTIRSTLRRKRRNAWLKEGQQARLLAAVMTRPNPPPGYSRSTPRRLPPEREHVLALGTLNTRSRNAVETCPSLHPSCRAQFIRWVTGGGDCPQLWRKWGNSPMLVMAVVDWQDLGPPKRSEKTVIITWEVLQVTIVAGELVQFLADMGNTNSVQTSHTGSLAPETCSVAEGKLKLKYFTTLLTCTWLKTFKFLVMPEYP